MQREESTMRREVCDKDKAGSRDRGEEVVTGSA